MEKTAGTVTGAKTLRLTVRCPDGAGDQSGSLRQAKTEPEDMLSDRSGPYQDRAGLAHTKNTGKMPGARKTV